MEYRPVTIYSTSLIPPKSVAHRFAHEPAIASAVAFDVFLQLAEQSREGSILVVLELGRLEHQQGYRARQLRIVILFAWTFSDVYCISQTWSNN